MFRVTAALTPVPGWPGTPTSQRELRRLPGRSVGAPVLVQQLWRPHCVGHVDEAWMDPAAGWMVEMLLDQLPRESKPLVLVIGVVAASGRLVQAAHH